MGFAVSMILGSFAEVQNGGLTVVNGGWTVRAPEPADTAAIGVVIAIPREYSGTPIDTRMELLDSSGEPVPIIPLDEEHEEMGDPGPIQVGGEVVAEGLDDPRVTIPLVATLAVNLPPFRLPPGQEFRWQLYLNEETQPEWALHFRTTPPGPA